MGIYQSSGRTRDPLGGVAMPIGIAGAFASVVLWAYQLDPRTVRPVDSVETRARVRVR